LYSLLKPLIFRINPEKAHYYTMALLEVAVSIAPIRWIISKIYKAEGNQHNFKIMGLTFPNRVGLAAGFDKDGKHIAALSCLGFGFVEVGTVTPIAQGGNPQPRLFRLPKEQALINRMGFNNEGLDALVSRLKDLREKGVPNGLIIGGNIGKNKDTPNETAADDYLKCFEALFPYVDYFVVNVSSPNTPNLRALQEKEPLTKLLTILQQKNNERPFTKPILLKVAPDLTTEQIADIAEIVKSTKLTGVIASNTTIDRSMLLEPAENLEKIGMGGLSGIPVREKSNEIIHQLRTSLGKSFVIIGVGGIHSAEDAKRKYNAGADLVQIYTGLVYEGPSLIKKIVKIKEKV
jgi:dihydroorotate dehydrogenase